MTTTHGPSEPPAPASDALPSARSSGPAASAPAAAGPSSPAVATENLTKHYGRTRTAAVSELTLTVPRGSVFGFLGPNGSGKTTTIRMLLGLIAPTSGGVRVLGEEMPGRAGTVLPRVGALIEGPALYPFLSGRANLARFDAADPTAEPRTRERRISAALDRVGLSHAAAKKARAYSLGMKQRLGIAAALLQPRELLVLDEPTNGLDPQGMREVRTLVRSLAADDGTTVFLSSHLLDEIEQVCGHAAVMARGKLLAQGRVEELTAGARGTFVLLTDADDEAAAARVFAGHGLARPESRQTPDGLRLTAPVDTPDTEAADADPAALVAALVGAGVRVRSFTTERGTLEDAFVALTGEGFDVAG